MKKKRVIVKVPCPEFLKDTLAHRYAPEEDGPRLEPMMKSWINVYHYISKLKRHRSTEHQLEELRKMILFELFHQNRMQILTRLLGRYKMTVVEELEHQMFGR